MVVTSVVKGCASPSYRAHRILHDDPCGAAVLLAEDVRRDWKGSMVSLHELTQINEPCALRELIGLMDVPDGRQIDDDYRRLIRQSVQARTASAQVPPPRYSPSAEQPVRERQKAEWVKWYQTYSAGGGEGK